MASPNPTNRTVSSDKRDEILRDASLREVPVEVTRPSSSETLRSRLLDAVTSANPPHLVMDLPTDRGRPVAIHPPESLDVVFNSSGQRLAFRSTVISRCHHPLRAASDSLDSPSSVPALVVSYPHDLEINQRRAFYRVPLNPADPCQVTFGRLSPDPDSLSVGLAQDLSAGGIGIRSAPDDSLSVGARLRLWFLLPGEPRNLALLGTVRTRRALSDGGLCLGVEFVDTDHTLESRRAVGLIGKFVAQRQREILRRT